MPDDFCPEGHCPEGDAPRVTPEQIGYELTPDRVAHLAAGGALKVTDTRRGFLKRAGKIGAIAGAIGIFGKLSVEKAEAATCSGLNCPNGKYFLGYYDTRYSQSCPAGYTYDCWMLYRCWYDSTHYSDVWCKAHCGHC